MPINPATVKLGKGPVKHDRRTLLFENYIDHKQLPKAPNAIDWSSKVDRWGMMKNDQLGDCTCAAAGHMEMAWSADAGTPFTPTDDQILKAYEDVGGYVPGQPDTDQGAVELDVLNYWRKTGIAGKQIGAYVSVKPTLTSHLREAIYLFGGIYIGLALPISAQRQEVWDIVEGPEGEKGSWGGHAVPVIAYSGKGTHDTVTCITWGQTLKMTWRFFHRYCEEAYGVLSPQWFDGGETAPNHFNLEQLQADLAAL